MSKSEIQSWLSTATTSDDKPDDGSWPRDRVFSEWSKSLQLAQNKLLTSKTTDRIQFLEEELLSLAKHGGESTFVLLHLVKTYFVTDLNLSQCMDIFKLLTLTYPRYVDTTSREAVEAVGIELVTRDELRGTIDGPVDENKLGVTEQVLGWLSHEVGKLAKRGSSRCVSRSHSMTHSVYLLRSSHASSDVFVLLSWSCGLYTACLRVNPDFTATHSWRALVGTTATLLDLILDSVRTKPSMKRGAVVRTRRALRSAPKKIPTLISTLLAHAKSSQAPLTMVSLIGTAVDVTARLKGVRDESEKHISSNLKVL